MKAKREDYQSIIMYVAHKSSFSYHKARLILTSYSNQVQLALSKGYSIELDGLFNITFTSKLGFLVDNVKELDDIVKDIAIETEYSFNDVKVAVSSYLHRLRNLGKLGYQVNVKGIGYIIPKLNEEGTEVEIVPRISPVLEKPEIAEFVVMDKKTGEYSIMTLTKDVLRFKITISDTYISPKTLMTDNTLKLDYIDI